LYVLGHGGLGGIEQHVETLLGAQDRRLVDPALCVVMEAGPVSQRIAASGIPVHVIGARSGHDRRIFSALRAILRHVRPDVIHAHELQAFVVGALWGSPEIPLIASIHCALFAGSPHLWWNWIAGRTLERRVNYYLPVSEATWTAARRYCGIAPTRGQVFRNVIDLQGLPAKNKARLCEELGIPLSAPLVGMVGRMVEQKDWPAFVAVCREIRMMEPAAYFLAIGDGPLRATVQRAAEGAGFRSHVRWLGFRGDARQLIGGLDLFLLTSLHEEMPTTLLEAFALRTPVAGFLPRGGTREILALGEGRVAALLEARDAAAVAQEAVRLLRNQELALQQAARARTLVERHFDARAQCGHLLEIYDRVRKDGV
jgi:glycosyltransferase involved in cell wall biosynthesis